MARVFSLFVLALAAKAAWSQPAAPAFGGEVEGDWTTRNFTFHSGEKLAELRLHYLTIGKATRDKDGHVTNAVLILHGTGGSGHAFLSDNFAGELFGPGQPLDTASHYLILPDSIGHGKSSKPSDGLHARFPHYDYEDMVRAESLLVREGLKVDHLRLVMGTSMGAMHTWVWGYLYPQAIRNDPAWNNGEYTAPPVNGLVGAEYALWMMTSSPLELQRTSPTPEKADRAVADLRERANKIDANDMLYQFEASTDYNPAPHLGQIQALLFAINSADDEVNPPELDLVARAIEKVPHGRYILIPTSEETRGHGTHSRAAVWKQYLKELLEVTEPGGEPRR